MRRLDREEPGPRRSRQLGPLRRAAGAQPRHAAHASSSSRGRGPRSGVARSSATSTPRAWTRRRSRRKGARPLEPLLKTIAALIERQASSRRSSPSCTRSASPRSSSFGCAGRLQGRDAGDGDRRSGRPRPARSRLLPARTTRSRRSCAKQYVDHVAQMLDAARRHARDRGEGGADRSMALETALAKVALDARRSPRSEQDLPQDDRAPSCEALTPQLRLGALLQPASARRRSTTLNVAEPGLLQGARRARRDDAARRRGRPTCAGTSCARVGAGCCAKALRRRELRLLRHGAHRRQGARPRWKRCVDAPTATLGEALGQAFVEGRVRRRRARRDTLRMVHDDRGGARGATSTGSTWMTPTTKKQGARRSCTPIANKIGYPDKWRDYTHARRSCAATRSATRSARNAFEIQRQLAKIGKPVDRSEWQMTPPTVNAYYDPLENDIMFPAGILQPPFFDARRPTPRSTSAAIGAVDRPRADARLRRPGPPVRRATATCGLVDRRPTPRSSRSARSASSTSTPASRAVDDVKLNGKLTLGENIADNGGLRSR